MEGIDNKNRENANLSETFRVEIQKSHRWLAEVINQQETESVFSRESEGNLTHIYKEDGEERFIVERIIDQGKEKNLEQARKIDNFFATMVSEWEKTFSSEEGQEVKLLPQGNMEQASDDDHSETQEEIEEGKVDYHLILNASGEVISISYTELVDMEIVPGKPTESVIVVWEIGVAQTYRFKGLDRELQIASLKSALGRAETTQRKIFGTVTEAIKLQESFFNNAYGLRRVYFTDAEGNYVELPCLSPPSTEEVLADDPKKARWRWMMRLNEDKTNISQEDFIRVIGSLYKGYEIDDETYKSAIEKLKMFFQSILRKTDKDLFLLTKRERVRASKNASVCESEDIGEWLQKNDRTTEKLWQEICEEARGFHP